MIGQPADYAAALRVMLHFKKFVPRQARCRLPRYDVIILAIYDYLLPLLDDAGRRARSSR